MREKKKKRRKKQKFIVQIGQTLPNRPIHSSQLRHYNIYKSISNRILVVGSVFNSEIFSPAFFRNRLCLIVAFYFRTWRILYNANHLFCIKLRDKTRIFAKQKSSISVMCASSCKITLVSALDYNCSSECVQMREKRIHRHPVWNTQTNGASFVRCRLVYRPNIAFPSTIRLISFSCVFCCPRCHVFFASSLPRLCRRPHFLPFCSSFSSARTAIYLICTSRGVACALHISLSRLSIFFLLEHDAFDDGDSTVVLVADRTVDTLRVLHFPDRIGTFSM